MAKRERDRSKVRWLTARLFLDNLNSLLRGWLFRIARPDQASSDLVQPDWVLLSESLIQVKWREEMKELNESRFYNMRAGCERVDSIRLKPGQVFSLRRFFGAASEAQGFQAGPVFMNGSLTFSEGGGVCVVASLLFDAAFKANLAILEKHNHSTDLWGEERFIHLGGDATYVYGRRDLKFRNTHRGDIHLRTEFDRDKLQLTCRIYSPQALEYTVRRESAVLEEIAPADTSKALSNEWNIRKGWVVLTRRYARVRGGQEVLSYEKKEIYNPFFAKKGS
ncbi:VanW family protein [Cohnella sp.]|uniref:VanW family protein n=1 Tax=Cohnella sp. TaxID=1883426 RepID=UPI0035653714